MSEGFSGYPLARWNGSRNMVLEEEFIYTDPSGKEWIAPVGSCLNGASIPRALWGIIGSPFSGKYRRASVLHDVFVGELCNPDVTKADRKKADRMFYHACRFDGCSRKFSLLLYIGVRFGTWSSSLSFSNDNEFLSEDYEDLLDVPDDDDIIVRFEKILSKTEQFENDEDLDFIDGVIDEYEDY